MKLTLSTGSIPAGSYLAKFLGVEQTEPNQYGPGLRWMFEITTGPQAGTKISRTTGMNPTQKNACGKMLIGISGRTAVGEEIDLNTCLGKLYLIVVVQKPEGGTSLESVSIPPIG